MPQPAPISPPYRKLKMSLDPQRTKSTNTSGATTNGPCSAWCPSVPGLSSSACPYGQVLQLSQNEIPQLVETYAERLVRYAFRLLGNLEDAEDVVQEVFVRTLSDRSRYAKISAIGPYLYRSVANASTDLLRKRNCAAVFCEEVEAEKLLSGAHGPAEAVQATEGLSRAEAWLKHLPEEQAQAIRLRVFDGLSLNDIAAVLECR